MNPNKPALQPSPWHPLYALRRVALGTLMVASSSLALSPFSISLTGNAASKSISVVSSNGTWDSLVVSHREPSALSEALVGLSTTSSGLKVTGSALMTGVGNTQSLSVPEAGVYWVYAKRATAANASPDSVWAAGRVEFAPEEGRLTTWYDVTRKALYIRIVVPSALSLGSKVEISVTDTLSTSPSAIFDGLVSVLPSSQSASVRTAPTGAIIAWIHLQRTKAPDSVNVVFPAAVAGAKPVLLHASRPIRDPNLEGTAHLLERIQSETNNPLVQSSTTTYAAANQLHFWSALVDSVPTWVGHTELLRGLLTAKKGTATVWSDAVPSLSSQKLNDTLKASMSRPVVARSTQQNLTGPVYYGAYTRATFDNDLHFPLGEGELLQILWQGSIDLYYMEPATTAGQPGLLTRLALPAPPTGTSPPHPYLSTKQLILAQGSPLLAKIQDSGLWVKGVRVGQGAGFQLSLNAADVSKGQTNVVGLSKGIPIDELQVGSIGEMAIQAKITNEFGVRPLQFGDTLAFLECATGKATLASADDASFFDSTLTALPLSSVVGEGVVYDLGYVCDEIVRAEKIRTHEVDKNKDKVLMYTIELARVSGESDELSARLETAYGVTAEAVGGEQTKAVTLALSSSDEVLGDVGSSVTPTSASVTAPKCPELKSTTSNAELYTLNKLTGNGGSYKIPSVGNNVNLTQKLVGASRVLEQVRGQYYAVSNSPICVTKVNKRIQAFEIEPISSQEITVIGAVDGGPTQLMYNLKKDEASRGRIRELVNDRSARNEYTKTVPIEFGNHMRNRMGSIVLWTSNKERPVLVSCRDADLCSIKITAWEADGPNSPTRTFLPTTVTLVSGHTFEEPNKKEMWSSLYQGFLGGSVAQDDSKMWTVLDQYYNGGNRFAYLPPHGKRAEFKNVSANFARWAQAKTDSEKKAHTNSEGNEYGGIVMELNAGAVGFIKKGDGTSLEFPYTDERFPKLGKFRGSVHSHPNSEGVVGEIPCTSLDFSTPWTNGGWDLNHPEWNYYRPNEGPLPLGGELIGDFGGMYYSSYLYPKAIEQINYLAQPILPSIKPKLSGKLVAIRQRNVAEGMECMAYYGKSNGCSESEMRGVSDKFGAHYASYDGVVSTDPSLVLPQYICGEVSKGKKYP